MWVLCFYMSLLLATSESTNWNTLKQKVQLRLFTPDNYNILYELRTNKEAVWDLGVNLPCTVNDNLQTQVIPPPNFDASLPLKVLSHGFVSSTKVDCTNFVNAWMDNTNRRTNIILIEWLDLSHHTTDKIPLIKSFLADLYDNSKGLNTEVYRDAAKNAILVGRYVGHCVAALANLADASQPPHIHLVGHSLGSHLVGNAGRTFAQASGRKVERITALDPAGPGFIKGPLVEFVQGLYANRLNKNDAEFVDVIHTHSSLFGYLNPLGHADFYPDGGKSQENCEDLLPVSRIKCSHERSFHYYVNSIMEPRLFPSYECRDLNQCTSVRQLFDRLTYRLRRPDSFMGEAASEFKTGDSKMYFLKLDRNELWNYYKHMRTSVIHKIIKGTSNLIHTAIDASGLFGSNVNRQQENRNPNLGYNRGNVNRYPHGNIENSFQGNQNNGNINTNLGYNASTGEAFQDSRFNSNVNYDANNDIYSNPTQQAFGGNSNGNTNPYVAFNTATSNSEKAFGNYPNRGNRYPNRGPFYSNPPKRYPGESSYIGPHNQNLEGVIRNHFIGGVNNVKNIIHSILS